jgi:hypothetical protein
MSTPQRAVSDLTIRNNATMQQIVDEDRAGDRFVLVLLRGFDALGWV